LPGQGFPKQKEPGRRLRLVSGTQDISNGTERFTFGQLELLDGFSAIVLLTGACSRCRPCCRWSRKP
jgi:hypothetical protein